MLNDPLFPLLLAIRYAHILGAITLMGSAVFMRFALVPSVEELGDETRKELHQKVLKRWAKVAHLAVALVLVSGIANLGLAARYSFDGPSYNAIAGAKFLFALPVLFLVIMLTGRSSAAQRFQANKKFWLNVNLTFALIMVLMGGFLRAIPRKLKSEGDKPAATAKESPKAESKEADSKE